MGDSARLVCPQSRAAATPGSLEPRVRVRRSETRALHGERIGCPAQKRRPQRWAAGVRQYQVRCSLCRTLIWDQRANRKDGMIIEAIVRDSGALLQRGDNSPDLAGRQRRLFRLALRGSAVLKIGRAEPKPVHVTAHSITPVDVLAIASREASVENSTANRRERIWRGKK